MKRLSFILLWLCLVACAGPRAEPVRTQEEDEWDIRETVYRYQFDHNASGAQQGVDYYFLEMNEGEDPPAEFMARFADHSPIVEPVSTSTTSMDGGVSHKESGGTGLIFRVTGIRWLDENTVEVDGGYYEAGLSASGNTYRVEYVENQWTVTEDTMHWIS